MMMMMMKKKKTKWQISKFVNLPAEHGHLPYRPVYSVAVLYLSLCSIFSAIFSLFQDFAPIQKYRENETTSSIPT